MQSGNDLFAINAHGSVSSLCDFRLIELTRADDH